MNRRKFLMWLARSLWGGWVVAGFGFLSKFLKPEERAGATVLPSVGIDDVPVNGSKILFYQRNPVILIRKSKDKWVALSAICTHLRCGVKWEPESKRIVCPCHGAIYDLNGNVISGPPPRPLKRYTTIKRSGKVYIREEVT